MSIELNSIVMGFGSQELFSVDQLIIPTSSKVGVIGDNGSGKSTLFSLIQGTLLPDYGQVYCSDEISTIEQLVDAQTTYSGGEQTKQRIIKAFQDNKGILLADEPTNHLDHKGILFLEKKIKTYQGTLLVISHNRTFLNHVVDKILAIENGKLTLYEGNYAAYERQKQIQNNELQKKYDYYQREKQHIQAAMGTVSEKSSQTKKAPKRMGNSEARLHKMGDQRAKQNLDNKSKALATRLEKLEVVEKPKEKSTLVIPFLPSQKLYRTDLIVGENYTLEVDYKVILDKTDFCLVNGSKTALTGVNGAGKTSFLKKIIAKDSSINFAQGINFGYFSQTFEQLKDDDTIYQTIARETIHKEQTIRNLLAHMQFRKDEIYKKIGILSGGERSKVAISQLLLSECNILLLDEPTNHLDISSIKVMKEALKAYQGTILFTSHDESFVNSLAKEKWIIKDKKILVLSDQERPTIKEEEWLQNKLLLENKKTMLISQLSTIQGSEKERIELEFQEVIKELNCYK